MTGSYLLYNELHYNVLMTDLGLLLLLRAEDTKIGKSRKVLPDCFVHTAE